jgi:hypothetical protein
MHEPTQRTDTPMYVRSVIRTYPHPHPSAVPSVHVYPAEVDRCERPRARPVWDIQPHLTYIHTETDARQLEAATQSMKPARIKQHRVMYADDVMKSHKLLALLLAGLGACKQHSKLDDSSVYMLTYWGVAVSARCSHFRCAYST